MTTNDELTPEIVAELRARLERQRATLRTQLGMEDEQSALGTMADIVGDAGDSSVDLEEADVEADMGDDLRADLADVEHALARMDAGTYGLCEECGRPIPLARLRALPASRYDAPHAADAESRAHPR